MDFNGRAPSYTERRLERACQYVSDLWLPVNPQLVSSLQAALNTARDDSSLDDLISEIQGDFSLYLYCLRELLRLLRESDTAPPTYQSPVELFRWAGIERLREVLKVDGKKMSAHALEGMSDFQKQRLQEVVISASASKVLSAESGVSGDLGYSAALLRQLGLTLIAWNYPSVYERALSLVRQGQTADAAITQVLGFSPGMLAFSLVRKWGITPRLTRVLEEDAEVDSSEINDLVEATAIGDSVVELCKIGEALARANNPSQYPSARQDWEKAKTEIVKRIGPAGLDVIREAVIENSQNYVVAVPAYFKGAAVLDPEAHIAAFEQETFLNRNPYIQHCRAAVKNKLHELYDMLSRGEALDASLVFLVREAIPAAAFSGGVVYTIDLTLGELVPQTKIGYLHLRGMENIPYSSQRIPSNFIALAYQSDEPVSVSNVRQGEAIMAAIAGFFGYSQRMGVLYLELPQLTFRGSEAQHFVHFKALACALNDCLGLKG